MNLFNKKGLIEVPEDSQENEENEEEKESDDDLDDEDDEDEGDKKEEKISEETPEKIVDVLILDSPFANFRGMIHDVIHSQFKVCGCCINMALSGVLKDCKKKINKDLTLIKPIEAVPYIEVPTFYMVGKGDIIARPEKVKELFLQTKSKVKEYHTFEGEHPSHRDKYILKKAILFILKQFDRLSLGCIPSTISMPTFENKKEKNAYYKRLTEEHKEELFMDPPTPKSKKPKNITKPKELNKETKKDMIDLSGDPEDGRPDLPGPTLPIQPKQGIDEISGNLEKKVPSNLPESNLDSEKQALVMSFSENPTSQKFNENKPNTNVSPPLPESNQDLNKSPIVTGNSSPK